MEEGSNTGDAAADAAAALATPEPLQDLAAPAAGWLDSFEPDLKNNPTLQKYKSQEEANKGHLELAASFGKDRVAWPTDENDTAAWEEINNRLGVQKTASGYALEDIASPDGAPGLLNKARFQEALLASGATKDTGEKLWESYTNDIKAGYQEANAKFVANVEGAKAELMQEWGEAYEGKVSMGQKVIDTFADTQKEKDELTVSLMQTTAGIKLLSKMSDFLKESSIGGFQDNSTFTKTPDEARLELATIKAGPDYRSDDERVRGPAIDRANVLMRLINPGM